MPKRKRKKSKLVPILWLVTLVLFAMYFFYTNFDLKRFFGESGKIVSSKGISSSSLEKSSKISFNQPKNISSSEQLSSESKAKDKIKIKLYLGKMTDKFVSIVPIEKEIDKTETPLKDTLRALIEYRDEKFLNLIPLNTKINNVWIKDAYVYIDFSEEFNYNSYGVAGYNIQIYQVVYTATQFANLKGVYFYINGKPLKYLGGEGFIINNPVKPYTSLPKFSF